MIRNPHQTNHIDNGPNTFPKHNVLGSCSILHGLVLPTPTRLLVALTQSIKSSLDSLCSGPSRYLVEPLRFFSTWRGAPWCWRVVFRVVSFLPKLWKSKMFPQILVTFQIQSNRAIMPFLSIFHFHDYGRKGKSGEVWAWLKPFRHSSKRSRNFFSKQTSKTPVLGSGNQA